MPKNDALPKKLVFVDIETTGARVTSDRVIEIGIIRVENNQVTQTYQTLFNPQTRISPYIEVFTGIRQDDLRSAPTFEDKIQEITALLHDCVFIAHNVRFDYGFLKNEFSRLDMDFSPAHLCTVKLSRQLFPQYKKHNLSSLIERFNLACPNRHRALDDAQVIWQFYQLVQNQFENERLATLVKTSLRRPTIPATLKAQSLAKLPTQAGVYIFYDAKGYPLYVGKSKSIKNRVLSHFSGDYTSSKEMNICQQVTNIETTTTAGELSALLLESELVKKLQPLYNRKLRLKKEMVIVTKSQTPDGFATVTVEAVDKILADSIDSIIGVFKSKRQAKEFLLASVKEQGLCHKLLGLEKTTHACFPYQLGWCKGACLGKESPERYNLRFSISFTKSSIKPWPFSGPILIKEYDESIGKSETLVVDNWCLIERSSYDETINIEHQPDLIFDWDVYMILRSYLTSPANQKNISVISLDPELAIQ
jgi:DNA polymerase III subunit epsilon